MKKTEWALLLLLFWACTSEVEKGKILLANEIKSNLPYPDSFELIQLDTLDCYEDTKRCIFRVTFNHKTDTFPNLRDLSFIVLNEASFIEAISGDIREIDEYVKLSTYHNYAKNIDFGSKHLLGDFDLVSTEELKQIDLESRGLR